MADKMGYRSELHFQKMSLKNYRAWFMHSFQIKISLEHANVSYKLHSGNWRISSANIQ